MMGGVFSDLSLAFKESFDIVAGVTYSLVVVCPPSYLASSFKIQQANIPMRCWTGSCFCAPSY